MSTTARPVQPGRRRGPVTAVLPLLAVLAACGTTPSQPGPIGPTGAPSSATTAASTSPPPTSAGTPVPGTPESNPAGDIPDNQVYVPFTGAGFTVSVPEGWSRSATGAVTVFADKLNSVRVQTARRATAPTTSSVSTEDIPALRSATTGFTAGPVKAVTRRAGPVVQLNYRATTAPDPATGRAVVDDVERYAFWHNGTELILTLSGPRGADNVDPWRTITDSVRWSS